MRAKWRSWVRAMAHGWRPNHVQNSVTPSDHTSAAAASYAVGGLLHNTDGRSAVASTSGAANAGVVLHAVDNWDVVALPKSVRHTVPAARSTSTLSGLTSRWYTPYEWQ